jgi:hypothetical protein
MNNLPRACYKKDLHEKLNDVPTRFLTELINNTIVKCRKVTLDAAKKLKKITKKECEAVMVEVGEIDG